jgi:hypothetical protein
MVRFIQNVTTSGIIKDYIGNESQWKIEKDIVVKDMKKIKERKVIRHIIFSIWLVLIILWNYKFPDAIPFEDVFVTICLSLFAKSLERNLGG